MTDNLVAEICIVGAGVVGLTLALALGQNGFKVILVEQNNLSGLKSLDLADYDPRVYAINLASKELFEQYGAWDLIQQSRVSPYTGMEVWDAKSNGNIEFSADNIYHPELGHIIEQKVIQHSLWTKLKLNKNITVIESCSLEEITNSTKGIRLKVNQPKDILISAKLIVGADGVHSWVKEQLGITTDVNPYQQTAIIARVKTEKPHLKVARQRFDQDGPLALLPLDDPNYCSIVWTTSPEQAEYFTKLSSQDFSSALTKSFGSKLGKLSLVSNTFNFPLVMRNAKSYCKPRGVLVGDAAHVIHPLAGLGLNLGLRNVKVLVDEIISQRSKLRDISSLSCLRKYERKEKSHALVIIKAMQAFKQGFGTENKVIKSIRNIGLNFTNRHQLLKNSIIKLAMN